MKPSKKAAKKTKPAQRNAARPPSERKKAAPSKAGRKEIFTDELADQICVLLADGMSLREICAKEAMPDRATVRRWIIDRPNFAAKYARAREAQADSLFEDIHEIEAKTVAKTLAPDIARVVISSKQWRAAKLRPKVYGDRITHQGDDEAAPIQIEATELTMAQRAARLSSVLALAHRKGAAT